MRSTDVERGVGLLVYWALGRMQLAPNANQRRSELVGAVTNPAADVFRGKPLAGFNFVWMKGKRTFCGAAIDPDEFLAGLFAGVDAKDALRNAGQDEAEFLFDFTYRTRIVRFTGIEMACGRGIPALREGVLFRGALLQEHLAIGVEDEDVDCAVAQTMSMHFAARELADHLVPVVYDVEQLVWIGVVRRRHVKLCDHRLFPNGRTERI